MTSHMNDADAVWLHRIDVTGAKLNKALHKVTGMVKENKRVDKR